MKVAFFLGSLRRGGAESLVYDVCRKRDKAPFDLCCIYRKADDFADAYQETGVELIQVPRTGNMFHYLRDLRKTVKAHGIDIVHAQTASNALVSFFAFLFSRVKAVTTFHGFSFSNAPKWYRRLVYDGSKRIICVSEFEKQHYVNKWKLPLDNKFRVVYNGIDFTKLDCPQPDPASPFQLDGNAFNMVMVGSFIEGRAQYFVCQALRRLSETDVPFQMYFVGRRDEAEPARYDRCVAFCEENGLLNRVHFLGNRTDVPWLLRQMDLFFYATDHDTFGIAVIEALASGLPVLVNDWDVMKEITDDGRWATLFRTGDVEDCVAKLTSLSGRPTERMSNAKAAESFVRERYSIENHITALFKVYEEAAL